MFYSSVLAPTVDKLFDMSIVSREGIYRTSADIHSMEHFCMIVAPQPTVAEGNSEFAG
jgi:hypothetical protein